MVPVSRVVRADPVVPVALELVPAVALELSQAEGQGLVRVGAEPPHVPVVAVPVHAHRHDRLALQAEIKSATAQLPRARVHLHAKEEDSAAAAEITLERAAAEAVGAWAAVA